MKNIVYIFLLLSLTNFSEAIENFNTHPTYQKISQKNKKLVFPKVHILGWNTKGYFAYVKYTSSYTKLIIQNMKSDKVLKTKSWKSSATFEKFLLENPEMLNKLLAPYKIAIYNDPSQSDLEMKPILLDAYTIKSKYEEGRTGKYITKVNLQLIHVKGGKTLKSKSIYKKRFDAKKGIRKIVNLGYSSSPFEDRIAILLAILHKNGKVTCQMVGASLSKGFK